MFKLGELFGSAEPETIQTPAPETPVAEDVVDLSGAAEQDLATLREFWRFAYHRQPGLIVAFQTQDIDGQRK